MGSMRNIRLPMLSIRIFEPKASKISILELETSSHDRAVNAKGLEVKAPTGQRSIIFPDTSLFSKLLI